MKTIRKYESKTYLGKVDGENIYLTAPSWNCEWYWGFGYLGNKDRHYHVDGLGKISKYNFDKKVFEYEFVNLFDGFKRHFDEGTFIVKSDHDLWTLCELFQTFYQLKHTAEMYHLGGANYTTNPCRELLKNEDEWKRINEVVLPNVFDEIYKILEAWKH